ncbi:MAG: hypothetical protein Q9162_005273 [Coniocarpon cinnabarinum]
MDAGSILGVVAIAGQVIRNVYAYGSAINKHQSEVSRLRCELFGLQAALKQINSDLGYGQQTIVPSGSLPLPVTKQGISVPSILTSSASRAVLSEAHGVLKDLDARLCVGLRHKDRLGIGRLLWPLRREDILNLVGHLERFKTYFIMAATTNTTFMATNVGKDVEDVKSSIAVMQEADKQQLLCQKVRNWPSPCEPGALHTSALSHRLDGTNAWFLDDTFHVWLLEKGKLLMLTGKPGSGKTCMMAACIDRAASLTPETKVAFFYCSKSDADSQKPANIVGSMAAQLCDLNRELRDRALQTYLNAQKAWHLHSSTAGMQTSVELFDALCNDKPDPVILFVDAINECGDESDNATDYLVNLATRHANISLMLVSTAITQARASVEDHCQGTVASMDVSLVKVDIRTYVNFRLAHDSLLQSLPQSLKDQIKLRIEQQSQGSFRWTQCTLDGLARMRTSKAVKTALACLPPTLESIYSFTLNAIPEDAADAVQSMLSCIVSSLRPLRLNELSEAAAFTFLTDFGPEDRFLMPNSLARHLQNLVYYEPTTQTLELAHSSVRDFLTSDQRDSHSKGCIRPLDAMDTMTQLCVSYLSLPAFSNICENNQALLKRKEEWPLKTRTAITGFLMTSKLDRGGNFAAWYQCVNPEGDPRIWMSNPLYMCAREGLVDLIHVLLSSGENWLLEERGGSRGSTPLHVAATYNEKDAVQALLDAGANPNERNDFGESGIQWAQFYGWTDIVQMLLEAGADGSLLDQDGNRDTFRQMQEHYSVPSVRHSSTDYESGTCSDDDGVDASDSTNRG